MYKILLKKSMIVSGASFRKLLRNGGRAAVHFGKLVGDNLVGASEIASKNGSSIAAVNPAKVFSSTPHFD